MFRSVQGESSFAGLPCAFVRLTGCALRLVWCDSAYAFADGGTEKGLDNVVAEVVASGRRWSGSPGGALEQEGFFALASALRDRGYTGRSSRPAATAGRPGRTARRSRSST